jgi:predicted amidohydrolase YtcJ
MTTGQVLGAGERLSRVQALRALTVGGAWLTFAERDRGVLAPGRAADLAVLDRDPLAAPSRELAETTARLTMVGRAGRARRGLATCFPASPSARS